MALDRDDHLVVRLIIRVSDRSRRKMTRFFIRWLRFTHLAVSQRWLPRRSRTAHQEDDVSSVGIPNCWLTRASNDTRLNGYPVNFAGEQTVWKVEWANLLNQSFFLGQEIAHCTQTQTLHPRPFSTCETVCTLRQRNVPMAALTMSVCQWQLQRRRPNRL